MTTWLESANVHQDGTPVTRKIKIPEMGEEIWFTDNAYAEVSNDVADILANNIDSISKVAEPSSPGTYYGDANSNTTVQINISDGVFDTVTAESIASDAIDTGERLNGQLIARPGEVQSKLDNASSNGIGSVGLVPDAEYDPSTRIDVHSGTTLYFNGAWVRPTTDTDLFFVDSEARIIEPQIDYQSLDTYTSNVFTFSTIIRGARYARGHRTYIRGGHTQGNNSGTVVYLEVDNNDSIAGVVVDHNTRRVGKVYDLYSQDTETGGAFINGNVFKGTHLQHNTFAHFRSDRPDSDGVHGNVFEGMVQPGSDYGFRLDQGHGNVFFGYWWDMHLYANGALYAGPDAGPSNKIVHTGAAGDQHVTNESSHATNGIVSLGEGYVGSSGMQGDGGENFGSGTGIDMDVTGRQQTAIGTNATTAGSQATTVGFDTQANQLDTVIGHFAESNGDRNAILGAGAGGTGRNSVLAGAFATADHNDTVVLGRGASSGADAVSVIGRGMSNSVPETCAIRGNVKYTRSFVDSANTTAYTTTTADEVVGVDTGTAAVTVTLDSTSAGDDGHKITVKDEGGNAGTNAITVDTAGSETIDGSSSVTISSNYGSVTAYSDGTNWFTK